jgi:hypothetical protein
LISERTARDDSGRGVALRSAYTALRTSVFDEDFTYGMARDDSGRGVALRSAYTALRTSVFDEDFTYGMGATWRTYFAHLGRTAGNNGGGCG